MKRWSSGAIALVASIALLIGGLTVAPPKAKASVAEPYATTERREGSGAISLYKTFVNPSAALEQFKNDNPDFMKEVEALGFPPISTENATAYKEYAIGAEKGVDIISFFDTFENDAENGEILSTLDEVERGKALGALSDEDAEEIVSLVLPSNEENNAPIARLSMNVNSACSYASTYATSPNSKYGVERNTFGIEADCTNFASQIAYAGGVPMNYSDSTSIGWWWKSQGNKTNSWVRASTFARYMRHGYVTTSWSSLKANVKAGDFIGFDSDADGAVDHIGFVYAKSGSSIRIAQHTSNYLKWDSSTGWPGMENGTVRFYRIGR